MVESRVSRLECLEPKHLLTGNPQLVADIANETTTDISGSFSDQDRLYFYASGKHSGRELWETDGTPDGTQQVADFAAGPTDSIAGLWGQLGSVRIFFANNQLWASPESGTDPILLQSDVNHNFGGTADRLFFGKDLDLWVTDGTVGGTFAIYNEDRVLEAVSSKDGEALFRTEAGEYWHTDGTLGGAKLLFDNFSARRFVSGSFPVVTMRPAENGWMFRGTDFGEDSQPIGEGLWFTDGSRVNSNSFVPSFTDIKFLAEQSENVLISTGNREYWVADGTASDVTKIFGRLPSDFAGSNSDGFYLALSSNEETSLWKISGPNSEPMKTRVIADHLSFVRPIGDLPDDRFVFRAYASGQESYVWVSDGSESGTRPLPIPITTRSRFEITHGDASGAFAIEVTEGEDISLWVSDGTAENTWLASSTVPQGVPPKFGQRVLRPRAAANDSIYVTESINDGSQVLWELLAGEQRLIEWQTAQEFEGFEVIGDGLTYLAREANWAAEVHPLALWQVSLDAGLDDRKTPQLIRDLNTTTEDADIGQLVSFRDSVFFVKDGQELWSSDGTAENTSLVFRSGPSNFISHVTVGSDHVYFLRGDRFGVVEVWRTEGISQGTELVEENVRFPTELKELNGNLYLNTLAPQTLWRLDESTGDRREVLSATGSAVRLSDNQIFVPSRRTVVNSATGELTQLDLHGIPRDTFNFADRIAFNLDDEVWASDGTAEGTFRLAIGKGEHFVQAGSQLRYAVGNSIYQSDGTTAGTSMLAVSLPSEAEINSMHYVGDALLVFFQLPRTRGEQLVVIRGGSTLELLSLPGRSYNKIVSGDQLFFSFEDQFWKTDGSTAGTRQIRGVFPVDKDANARTKANDIVFSNNELFFLADDGSHGEELWKLPLSQTKPAGDVTRDGVIDFTDFLVLSENFGNSVFPGELGDLDEDGLVDFADFLTLSAAF